LWLAVDQVLDAFIITPEHALTGPAMLASVPPSDGTRLPMVTVLVLESLGFLPVTAQG
jgi:hypothetical protein